MQSLGPRMVHCLGLQWDQHLVLMRGCQMDPSWVIQSAGCLGLSWGSHWGTGLVQQWETGLGFPMGLHWGLNLELQWDQCWVQCWGCWLDQCWVWQWAQCWELS